MATTDSTNGTESAHAESGATESTRMASTTPGPTGQSSGTSSPLRLESRLAEALLIRHPMRAAVALEQLGLGPAVAFLAGVSPGQLASVVPLLSQQLAGELLRALPTNSVAGLLSTSSDDVAARLARGLGARVDAVLERLPDERRASLASSLRYPADSAGGLMDPNVLSLPGDLSAEEALARVRELSRSARYNLYVVDREQHLIGVLNLRELLLAEPASRLDALMVPRPHSLPAAAGRASIIAHPGWREAHSLPVVDEQGRYVGAIRYRTLRALEETLRSRAPETETAQALGELLAVGAGGLVRAWTASGRPGPEDPH